MHGLHTAVLVLEASTVGMNCLVGPLISGAETPHGKPMGQAPGVYCFPGSIAEPFGPDPEHCSEEKWQRAKEAMLLALPTSSFMEPLEPRKQVYSSPQQGHHVLFHLLIQAIVCPLTHSQILRWGHTGWPTLRLAHSTLHVQAHTHTPCTDSLTFSSSCLSCFVRASREHMVCWGATTVQIHLPSLSWAELYTCQLSSGLVGNTWRGQVGKGMGREQENEGENEGGWRLGARG